MESFLGRTGARAASSTAVTIGDVDTVWVAVDAAIPVSTGRAGPTGVRTVGADASNLAARASSVAALRVFPACSSFV
jgi:hypothetical protein